jgi:hypothetical protein
MRRVLFRAWFVPLIWLRRELPCGCHWQRPFGAVVMAGCPKHD